eukprot:7439596-Lingulodinium_polyedra.AAC.1
MVPRCTNLIHNAPRPRMRYNFKENEVSSYFPELYAVLVSVDSKVLKPPGDTATRFAFCLIVDPCFA